MSKDYVRYANKPRKIQKKNRGVPLLILFLLVLLSLLFWFYKGGHAPHFFQDKPKEIIKQPQAETEVHFAFYSELASMNMQNTPPVVQVVNPPKDPQNTASAKTAYILQLGIYTNENQASEARISFLLSGADPVLVQIGDHYRLQEGPFKTQAAAKALQKKLLKRGVETTIETFYF